MATGRTIIRWLRAYADGVDLSGYARQAGPLVWDYEAAKGHAFSDAVDGSLPNHPTITPTAINAFLDPTTGGLHTAFSGGAGAKRSMMIPQGIRAEPANGDPVFMGDFEQLAYQAMEGDGYAVVYMSFAPSVRGASLVYEQPWGFLVHAKGAETAVNTAVGIDDNGGSSALGGLFGYQLFTSNGTVTLKLQDAATNTNPSFADLTGATSGSIDASTTPVGGTIALAKASTVRRYIRWQLVFGTATTATFALSFLRANR